MCSVNLQHSKFTKRNTAMEHNVKGHQIRKQLCNYDESRQQKMTYHVYLCQTNIYFAIKENQPIICVNKHFKLFNVSTLQNLHSDAVSDI